ncbi:hypothetical protein DVH24_014916, partial [Malus domestica]
PSDDSGCRNQSWLLADNRTATSSCLTPALAYSSFKPSPTLFAKIVLTDLSSGCEFFLVAMIGVRCCVDEPSGALVFSFGDFCVDFLGYGLGFWEFFQLRRLLDTAAKWINGSDSQ